MCPLSDTDTTTSSRCLRPQLHDITREYAIALYSPKELQELQCKVVDAFAAARPVSPRKKLCGLRVWPSQSESDCATYVKNHIEHHIRGSLTDEPSEGRLPAHVEAWLVYPIPGDSIVDATFKAIGVDRLRSAFAAVESEANWAAFKIGEACWYHVAVDKGDFVEFFSGGHNDIHSRVWAIQMKLVRATKRPQELTQTEYEYWLVGSMLFWAEWLRNFMGMEHLAKHLPHITQEDMDFCFEKATRLLDSSEIGRADGRTAADLQEEREITSQDDDGNFDTSDSLRLQRWQKRFSSESDSKDQKLSSYPNYHPSVELHDYIAMIRLPTWSWDPFDNEDMTAVMRSYDYEGDTVWPGPINNVHIPIAFLCALRGDIGAANEAFDMNNSTLQSLVADLGNSAASKWQRKFHLQRLMNQAHSYYPWVLYTLGRVDDAAQMLTSFGATWTGADQRADEYASIEVQIRKRGSTERTALAHWCAEEVALSLKLQYALCTTWREVSSTDVIAALPSPEVLESFSYVSNTAGRVGRSRVGFGSVLLLAAAVCEKHGQPADALLYLQKALRVDPSDPTTDLRPTTQGHGHALRGRLLATQGKIEEAEAAFEEAIEVSHRTGLRLLEMFAVRDLKKCVLDSNGRGDEGNRRLKAVLKEMKGPAAELTALLGGGLDADGILGSPCA